MVPARQQLEVGDEVRLAPEVSLRVAVAEAGRALVLRGGVPMGRAAPPYDFTWAFVLVGAADGAVRLVVRERNAYTPAMGRAHRATDPGRQLRDDPAHAARHQATPREKRRGHHTHRGHGLTERSPGAGGS